MVTEDHVNGMFGELIAHTAMLGVLAAIVTRVEPNFKAEALAAFDKLLGSMMKEGEPTDELKVKARESFVRLLTVADLHEPKKPLTLKRRFLNWLQSN